MVWRCNAQPGSWILQKCRPLYSSDVVGRICHYQLEAQAHGLPVIASKNCGKVVENGVNGIILDEPSAACIALAVRDCIASPDWLEKLASASGVRDKFTIEALANQLQRLGATL